MCEKNEYSACVESGRRRVCAGSGSSGSRGGGGIGGKRGGGKDIKLIEYYRISSHSSIHFLL